MHEARIEQTESGLVPADDGWFIITIGAGEGPCAILMVGTRSPDRTLRYLAEPAAARYGAAVPVTTDSPAEAYAGRPPITPARSPWPPSEPRAG